MKKRNNREIQAFLKDGLPTIKETNPQIKEIIIAFDFSDNHEYSHEPYEIKLNSSEKLFYAVDCINGTCTKGFIDITDDLRNLVKNGEKSISGKNWCEGWQDREREKIHRCFSNVKYMMSAIYDNE